MRKTCTFLITLFLLVATTNIKATVIYTEMNLECNQTSTWNWFNWGPDADGFGLYIVPGSSMHIETYQGAVIGYDDEGNIYFSPLSNGTTVGVSSTWLSPTLPSYINDASHIELNGTTFYAGFQLKSAADEIFYGWMQLSVAEDGLSFTLIDMAYEDEAGVDITTGMVAKQVVYESETFNENLVMNNGEIMNQIAIELIGVNFTVSSGNMIENTHYTLENVPEGLTVEIAANDATNATIGLIGQAIAHEVSDTVNNLTIHFLDLAFDGVPVTDITNSTNDELFVKYFGLPELIYEDLADEVCGFGGWVPFQSDYFENYFGIWHDGTDMRLETYGKDVVGTEVSGKSYVSPLNFNDVVGDESTWVTSGEWPNESYLTYSSYTDWHGQDKYAGIKLTFGEAIMYGWVRLEVSSDGSEVTPTEWAFNSTLNGDIHAGQIDNTGTVSFLRKPLYVYPNPCNNELIISLQEFSDEADLRVIDQMGRIVKTQHIKLNGKDNIKLDVSGLTTGILLIQLKIGDAYYTQKVIKE
jgi:hypothetical protein